MAFGSITESSGYAARWKALDRVHRQRVMQAMERGEPLMEPEDALLAHHFAMRCKRQVNALLALPPITVIVAFLIGVATGRNSVAVLLLAIASGLLVALFVLSARKKGRIVLEGAIASNAEVIRRHLGSDDT